MKMYLLATWLLLSACEGPAGPAGPTGGTGGPGTDGEPGAPGGNGSNGLSPWLTAPGVDIEVTGLTIDASSAVVAFTLKDPTGKALDRSGLLTEAVVDARFVLAQLAVDEDGTPRFYNAYTTREQTANGVTEIQATAESTGTFADVDVATGSYTYTFAAALTNFDPTLTQTVVASASRTIDDVRALDRATFSVRPAGGDALTRGFVATANCQGCHGEGFAQHGGRYNAVEQCETCHSSQTNDPDTGNTADFRVMIHKIHMGEGLPSVQNGTPYQIGNTTHDFSSVVYPQPVNNCESCHGGAERGEHWRTNPHREACLSCHDNVAFTEPVPSGMVLHGGGVQPENAPCNVCHAPTGSIAGVTESHKMLALSHDHETVVDILSVAPVTLGSPPSFTFRVTYDGMPRDILATPLASLRALIVGPNSDYTRYWTVGTSTNPWAQVTVQGSGAAGTLTAVNAVAGEFSYTFPATVVIPADATGSFTLALEGAANAADPRYPFMSPSMAFAVTDSTAVARRKIIDTAKCNSCHYDLRFHGGNRRGGEYCVTCHNPENANADRIARFEGSTVLAESVDFRVMIHKIHMGEELTQPYWLGANPTPTTTNPAGTQHNFGEVRYPRGRNECSACHVDGTWGLPGGGVASSILQQLTCSEDPAADTDSYCTAPFWTVTETTRIRPETAVCTSCHDAASVMAHAIVNTTMSGAEACATCHGPGSEQDVLVVHNR